MTTSFFRRWNRSVGSAGGTEEGESEREKERENCRSLFLTLFSGPKITLKRI